MEGDPGIDDRDVRIDAVVEAIDAGGRAEQGPDPRHAGRDGLGGQLGHFVGDDRHDVRVIQQREPLDLGQAGREPAQGLVEGAVRLQLVAGRVASDDRVRIRAGREHDDVATGRIRATVGIAGRLARRREGFVGATGSGDASGVAAGVGSRIGSALGSGGASVVPGSALAVGSVDGSVEGSVDGSGATAGAGSDDGSVSAETGAPKGRPMSMASRTGAMVRRMGPPGSYPSIPCKTSPAN